MKLSLEQRDRLQKIALIVALLAVVLGAVVLFVSANSRTIRNLAAHTFLTPNFMRAGRVADLIGVEGPKAELCANLADDFVPYYPGWDTADKLGLYCYHWAGFDIAIPDYAYEENTTSYFLFETMDEEGDLQFSIAEIGPDEEMPPVEGFANYISKEQFDALKGRYNEE